VKKFIIVKLTKILAKFGVALLNENVKSFLDESGRLQVLNRWVKPKVVSAELLDFILNNLSNSQSQLQQDLLAHYINIISQESSKIRTIPGYFVEFGAADGKTLSNSYYLEKNLGWKGILSEPARIWHNQLFRDRNCIIDTRCIVGESIESVVFYETNEPEFSTIANHLSEDHHAAKRKNAVEYKVTAISLQIMLEENGAPQTIDYLSIDTEGSEFDIIKSFDFNLWDIRFVSIEHNYTSKREAIFEYMLSQGYLRILSDVSSWDDWYIKNDEKLIQKMGLVQLKSG